GWRECLTKTNQDLHGWKHISSEIFFRLLASYREISSYAHVVVLSKDELRRATQEISDDTRNRFVRMGMTYSNILQCLEECGITVHSRVGDTHDGFTVTRQQCDSAGNTQLD
ncbi:hypothetical protein PENTCL1PPCAC_13302, partial [Pristionchus entomophagus]